MIGRSFLVYQGKLPADDNLNIVGAYTERQRQPIFCVGNLCHLLCSRKVRLRCFGVQLRHPLKFQSSQIDLEFIKGGISDRVTNFVLPDAPAFSSLAKSVIRIKYPHLVATILAVQRVRSVPQPRPIKNAARPGIPFPVTPVRLPATNQVFAPVGLLSANHPIAGPSIVDDLIDGVRGKNHYCAIVFFHLERCALLD